MPPLNARIDTLGVVETTIWDELARATQERAHAWRLLTLATAAADGRGVARIVVLREVQRAARRLLFYTDARSPKLAQLRAQPLATLLAWSASSGWQLRLEVSLSAEEEGLEVSSRWARVKLSPSAQDYLASLPPGTPVDRYQPERGSRAHFAVVTAEVTAMDWLELHPEGHRRARFEADGARWLAP